MLCRLSPPLLACAAVTYASCLGGPAVQTGSTAPQDTLELRNEVLIATWVVGSRTLRPGVVRRADSSGDATATGNELFSLTLADGRTIAASDLKLNRAPRIEPIAAASDSARLDDCTGGQRILAELSSTDGAITAAWTATLRAGANYIITETTLASAREEIPLSQVVMLDVQMPGARVIGQVAGSPVATDTVFVAAEDPLAQHAVDGDRVTATRTRPVLSAGRPVRWSTAIGIVPDGQLRRGFQQYLERRRAHPYRQFLHYNSWYHLNIDRPDNRMSESECLDTVAVFARELIDGRGVDLDAFVWDDGWDDFDSLWGFHGGFPRGFRGLSAAAHEHGAAMGVWMSPWGGYGQPKAKRMEFGRRNGYETNRNGLSMAGPNYARAFRDRCMEMMRDHGVAFFKFDGMGGGNMVDGVTAEFAPDVDAIWAVTAELRRENPEVFISATVGTWPSPFWLTHADSIWRQGEDTGFHGEGDNRERWITYRDMFAYDRVVKRAPLYPLNSVMFHGLTIGERANPGLMPLDETSVAHETWMMFACGTGLLELYVDPNLLSGRMWDELAAAAVWARTNADALADSHWIGGNPGLGEVYGFAGWTPGTAVLTLRNPSAKAQVIELSLADALELPASAQRWYQPAVVRADAKHPKARINADETVRFGLAPFEVLVLDLAAADSPD